MNECESVKCPHYQNNKCTSPDDCKNRDVSDKRECAGSVSDVDSDRNVGVWFRAGCSGLLYRNYKAAGDVDLILVDGISFEPTKKQND